MARVMVALHHHRIDLSIGPGPALQRGVGLTEIVVGIAIGLLTTLVIFQILGLSQQSRAITVSGTEAMIRGGLAIYRMEMTMKHAGFGLGRLPTSAGGCAVQGTNVAGSAFAFSFQPVNIEEGGSGAPDRVTLLVGSHPLLSGRVSFDGAVGATTRSLVSSRAGFAVEDRLIAINPGATAATSTCRFMRVSDLPVGAELDVVFASGLHNPPPAGLGASGDIYNLGPQPRLEVWSLQGDRLIVSNPLASSPAEVAGIEVASSVVDFQAQYGIEAPTGELLWCASGDAACFGANDLSQVRGMRIALVVRSEKMERDVVTAAAPQWGAAGVPLYAGFATDPGANQYRYRVYEASAPLRNLIWAVP